MKKSKLADSMNCQSAELALELAPRCGDLTMQQRAVLELVAQGQLNKQIAYHLGISEATVKAHVLGALRRLGYVTRSRAVAAWLAYQICWKNGLVGEASLLVRSR